MLETGYILPKNSSGERLVYIRRDGLTYPLHAPPWRAVLSHEGFGTPPIDYVADRSPFQHGDTVRSFFLTPRSIQLIVLHNFCSRAEYWQGREDILDLLRPGFGTDPVQAGKLLYYLPGKKKRQIDVLIESGPGFTPQEGWREWSFTEALRFVAHDPTWYDPDAYAETLLYHAPALNLIFPITFPIVFDETAGIRTFVVYKGTWISYPSIDVVGPVTGFNLVNLVTGTNIGLSAPVPDGVTVTFNLQGIKTVTGTDGQNWLNRVTPDSDLSAFALVPPPFAPEGVNEFSLSGTGTSPHSRVVVRYNDRYFGI
jgi:hypothetical protein